MQEVTTITLSAWVFGDEITPVNIVGVGITFIGVYFPIPSASWTGGDVGRKI